MKQIKNLSILTLLFIATISCQNTKNQKANDNDSPPDSYQDWDIQSSYLGQKIPGLMPEVFAPGIVSTEEYHHGGSVFTPDMKAFYFTRFGGKKGEKYEKRTALVIQYKNNEWSEPVVATDVKVPFFSTDGNIKYWGNKYKERTNSGWSELKSLGAHFKDIRIMRLTVSSKGTYVFDEFGSGDGNNVIRYSRLKDGKHEKPRVFSKAINTGKWNEHPFIAPDESYLIWDAEKEGGYGNQDLYISFRQKDGSWGAGINLGDKINTALNDTGARVTPDGKYLFFNRARDIYWVDFIQLKKELIDNSN